MREPIRFQWKATHHLYIGFGVILYSCLVVLFEEIPVWQNNIFFLGTYIIADDVIEHTITAGTPLRMLTEKILDPIIYKLKSLIRKHFLDFLKIKKGC